MHSPSWGIFKMPPPKKKKKDISLSQLLIIRDLQNYVFQDEKYDEIS